MAAPADSKVKAAAAGAGGAGAAAVVLVWLLGQFGIDMPAEVGAACASLLSAAAAFAGGWLKPR